MLQECALPTKIGSSPLVQTRGQSKSPELAGLVLAPRHNVDNLLDDLACFCSERAFSPKQEVCRQD